MGLIAGTFEGGKALAELLESHPQNFSPLAREISVKIFLPKMLSSYQSRKFSPLIFPAIQRTAYNGIVLNFTYKHINM